MLSGVTLPLPTPQDPTPLFSFKCQGMLPCPLAHAILFSIVLLICSEVLEENCLHDNHKKLSLVNHPALLGHIWEFLKQVKLLINTMVHLWVKNM